MKIIERELNIVKNEMISGFTEPFESEAVSDFVFNNSKTIRAIFGVLYLKSLDIHITEEIYRILATGELIHNASLLHDDVVDKSEKRRNKISVWKKYNSDIAVLLGDYILNHAIKKLSGTDDKIIKSFTNCIDHMCIAEFEQYFSRNKTVSLEKYIEICKNKTGTLFGAILSSCMISADKNHQKAKEFAEKFGIYFQLKNDMDDYSAEQDRKNKICTATDILGIENTYILIDNYKQELLRDLKELQTNQYRDELERLIAELWSTKKS